jgi:hypothetical protein
MVTPLGIYLSIVWSVFRIEMLRAEYLHFSNPSRNSHAPKGERMKATNITDIMQHIVGFLT